MNIIFNMEIKGCQYDDENMNDTISCPYFMTPATMGGWPWCGHKDRPEDAALPPELDPSWCPMIKENI